MASETVDVDRGRDGLLSLDRLPVDGETLTGAATVFPVIALYFLIAILPVSFAIYASFFEIPLLNPNWTFVGLANYAEVLTIDRFWGSMWTGVVYMVGSTLFQLVVGLWLALVLNRITRFQKVLTAVIFTAYLIPTIVVALVSLFMFDEFVGVFGQRVDGLLVGTGRPDRIGLHRCQWHSRR